jgi:hypothetical protein
LTTGLKPGSVARAPRLTFVEEPVLDDAPTFDGVLIFDRGMLVALAWGLIGNIRSGQRTSGARSTILVL